MVKDLQRELLHQTNLYSSCECHCSATLNNNTTAHVSQDRSISRPEDRKLLNKVKDVETQVESLYLTTKKLDGEVEHLSNQTLHDSASRTTPADSSSIDDVSTDPSVHLATVIDHTTNGTSSTVDDLSRTDTDLAT